MLNSKKVSLTHKLSETDKGIEWIKLFNPEDQQVAVELLDQIRLVDSKEFSSKILALIIQTSETIDGPIGLYAEREVKKDEREQVVPLFNEEYQDEENSKHLRAIGDGPTPFEIKDPGKSTQVGSEGVVANLITQLCRTSPDKFFHHPGPDIIRKKKIRAFFLVADFIGSGDQASSYLSAAWNVASVKSWMSAEFLRFHVIAFSGTNKGARVVKMHKSKPVVSLVIACPTIEAAFDYEKAYLISNLCIKYDPIKGDPVKSLGYEGTGALIAFDHGCPNNAPRILHKSKKNRPWVPLFPKRVTMEVNSVFGEQNNKISLLKRLQLMNEKRLASGEWLELTSKEGASVILMLVALRKGPRSDEAISRNTGLTVPEIKVFINSLIDWGWVDDHRYVTSQGYKELTHIRKIKKLLQAFLQLQISCTILSS